MAQKKQSIKRSTKTGNQTVAAVLPCYKVKKHVEDLFNRFGPEFDAIYAVDDKCPEESGAFIEKVIKDPRVKVIYLKANQGVGGAVLAGFKAARQDGHAIAVKIDGDGQMDPALAKKFIRPILNNEADYTKGNRFFDPASLKDMPKGRIIGNAILSFVSKFSTGYWNIFDPTNGYLAINLKLVDFLQIDKVAKRYFFETDMMFRLSLIRAKVIDIPMKAIYEDEVSNLHFSKEAGKFMLGHTRNFIKRIGYNYFLRGFSIASLELLVGLAALLFGIIYGVIKMGGSEAQPAGTVMMAALPILTGIILLISFLNFDMQQTPTDPVGPNIIDDYV